jgi:hypothetical protein
MKLIVEHGARRALNCTEHNKESWIQKCNATTQMKYRESNEPKKIFQYLTIKKQPQGNRPFGRPKRR